MDPALLFTTDFEDGGEHLRLHVFLKESQDNLLRYHCMVTPGLQNLAVDRPGKLYEYLSFSDEFDLVEN